MKTKPIYLQDPYVKELKAKIIDVITETNGCRVILDQTIFYPMGGGQPTDQGIIEYEDYKLEVYQVMIKDGEIWHFLKSNIVPENNIEVGLKINWERRYKNMKVHSAGHIIDFALYKLGYSPILLTPVKGDHSKKPFIIYKGKVDKDIKNELENEANNIIKSNIEFTWYFEDLELLKKETIYLQPGLPTNKPLRALKLEGIGVVADGGTQVKSTSEVGTIKINSIDTHNDNTTIYYSI